MKFSILLALLLFAVFTPAKATTPLLLIINDLDPAAVTFTATTSDPLASDSSHTFDAGVTLTDFLTAPDQSLIAFPQPSTLTTFIDKTPVFDEMVADNISGSFVDLNVYTKSSDSGEGNYMTFGTTSEAFVGSLPANLSSYAAYLPAPGTMGSVYAGYEGFRNAPVLIGEYMVVPEPGQLGCLFLGGTIGMLVCRKRFHPI